MPVRTHTRFLCLSDELVDKILQELPIWSQLSISKVSKRLRRATLPHVFCSMHIRTRRDAFKLIHHLASLPKWSPFVKSITIDIPFWEINASSRIRRGKYDYEPEAYAEVLDDEADYIGVLANLERIVFNETAAADELSTINYVLRARKLVRLKHFVYTSSSDQLSCFALFDGFLFRHPNLVTLELPPQLLHSPSNLSLRHLTHFSGSPRFFLLMVTAPNLSTIKLVIPHFLCLNIVSQAIRSLTWVSSSVRHLECELGMGFSLDIIESAAKYLPGLESLKIKWDTDSSFESRVNVDVIGSLLLGFDNLKEFDMEAHVPLVEDTPTVEVADALDEYCPSLVACGWLSERWTRATVSESWTQMHRWK